MSEIDRYIICVPSHANDFKNIEKVSYGGIVLYTDHLAALAEMDELHAKQMEYKEHCVRLQTERNNEYIAALQARVEHLCSFVPIKMDVSLEYMIENKSLKAHIEELEAEIKSWHGSRDGVMQTMDEMEYINITQAARIKELEAALFNAEARIKEMGDMWLGIQTISTCTVEYQDELSEAKNRIKELTEALEDLATTDSDGDCISGYSARHVAKAALGGRNEST
jgi:chromosome segregation ATPase